MIKLRKLALSTVLNIAILIGLAVFSATINTAIADGGGHLWFYSQDPDTLPGPQPLPDPQIHDPKYIDTHSDPWLLQSVVIPSANWETPFTIWLGCHKFESLNTKLVVSINKDAFSVINEIKINETTLSTWQTSGSPPGCLAPHGVFNSAEFYGYAEIDVGNLYSPPNTPYKTAITISITLKEGVEIPANAKIHFDAYGKTNDGRCIFNPYSHDSTFVIPEPPTMFAIITSLLALTFYSYKRKKH